MSASPRSKLDQARRLAEAAAAAQAELAKHGLRLGAIELGGGQRLELVHDETSRPEDAEWRGKPLGG